MPDRDDEAVLRRLEEDGLLRRQGAEYRTTRRWQSAIARAALWLIQSGEAGSGQDLRLPIALALAEIYGRSTPDDDFLRFIEVLDPIETREVDPQAYVEHAPEAG